MPDPTDATPAILRDIRKDLNDQRTVLIQLVDAVNRLETRLEMRILALEERTMHLRDDLSLMLKTELMGRLTHFETRIEQRIDALAESR